MRQIPGSTIEKLFLNVEILKKPIYYVQETIKNNWSMAVLLAQIENRLYPRQGKTIHNFALNLWQL
jgi:predicted nuclease of restriction endonuclease-like (RecB) superfamily